jgi:hypothetical protein
LDHETVADLVLALDGYLVALVTSSSSDLTFFFLMVSVTSKPQDAAKCREGFHSHAADTASCACDVGAHIRHVLFDRVELGKEFIVEGLMVE